MASGRRKWTRRLVLLAAVVVYALLLSAGVVPNPLPGLWEWVDEDRPIAPDLVWQERLGARPASAAVAGETIAINVGSEAEVRDRGNGDLLRPVDDHAWPAEWVVVAGEGPSRVVITSERGTSGYEVRDPATGDVLHTDEEAVAIWTFQDARLDLRCDRRACQLRAYSPSGSQPAWITDLPGRRVGMLGANPPLAGASAAEPNRIHPAAAGPGPVPRVLGFPVETRRSRDAVVVIEVATGEVRQLVEPEDDEKIMVVGDRVIRSTVIRQHGICLASATGFDAVTGNEVWGPWPYHLWTIGSGCEQRLPPLHAGAALSVVGPEGQPMVVDAYHGRVLWTGEPEQEVVALSRQLAVIRDPEVGLSGVLLGGNGEPVWERMAEPDAEVLVTSCGVLVADRDPSRVYVWDPVTGDTVLSVPTSARVLACAPEGLVLASGRSIGFAGFVPLDGAPPGGVPTGGTDPK